MASNTLDYYQVNDLILNAGGVRSAAELHGWLCGLLCGGAAMDEQQWWDRLSRYLEFDMVYDLDSFDAEQITLFNDFLTTVQANIDDPDLRFAPMLPHEDQAELTRRVDELGLWCKEFLSGLASSGLAADANLSPESAEILRDLAQISLAQSDDACSDEHHEADWVELVEYVKITVLNLRAGLDAASAPASASPSQLH